MNIQSVLADLSSVNTEVDILKKSKLPEIRKNFADVFNKLINENQNRLQVKNNDSNTEKHIVKNSCKRIEKLPPDKIENASVKTFSMVKKQQDSERNNVEQNYDEHSDIISELAGLMGIRPNMLQNIFDKLDINISELEDRNNINMAAENISKCFKLTPDEQQVVAHILNKVAVEYNMIASEDTAIHLDNVTKQFQLQVNTEMSDDVSADKINSADIMQTGEAVFEFEAAKDNVQDILYGIKEKALLYIANSKDSAKLPQKLEAYDMKHWYSSSEHNQETDKGAGDSKSDFKPLLQNVDFTFQKPETFEVFTADNKAKNAEGQIIVKSEFLNHVVERAKVILSPEKSEMVIDLKPDTLGKLSLKIVTERDVVMAKFTADNQQVKEILESNMEFLKDSLEKQGFNVQGFSVSVGKDSSSDNADRQNNVTPMYNAKHLHNISSDKFEHQISEIARLKDYYGWSTSSIDFTA